MPRKGKRLKRLKNGQLIGSSTANELIDFYNAFMAIKIVDGKSNDILIGDLAILLKIKGGTTPSDGGNSSYRGEYSPDGTTPLNPGPFLPGDIVRVSPSNSLSTPLSGTIIPGVYVCVLEGAELTDYPRHPLSPGGETEFWQWISTWPSVSNGCDVDGNVVSRFTDEQDSNA